MTEDQNTISNTAQTESIVKKILTAEVKYAIGIVIFLVGVVAPYYDIKTEIALIKQNHYAHIETMSKDILKCGEEVKALREDQEKIIQDQSKMIELIISNKTRLEMLK